MTNLDEVKDKFYDDLDSVISAAPWTDKLILLGDFNARVGTDHLLLTHWPLKLIRAILPIMLISHIPVVLR